MKMYIFSKFSTITNGKKFCFGVTGISVNKANVFQIIQNKLPNEMKNTRISMVSSQGINKNTARSDRLKPFSFLFSLLFISISFLRLIAHNLRTDCSLSISSPSIPQFSVSMSCYFSF